MKQITVVLDMAFHAQGKELLGALVSEPLVEKIILMAGEGSGALPEKYAVLTPAEAGAAGLASRILEGVETPYLLFLQGGQALRLGPRCLERFVEVAETARAGMVYGDYYETTGGGTREHPVNDYQLGSIREDFDFGPLTLFSRAAIVQVCRDFGPLPASLPAALYDLRLKVATAYPLFHIREFLYQVREEAKENNEDRHFAYQDPRNRAGQLEMETVATAHLRRLGAYLEPVFADLPPERLAFPCEASVVIPVRNRVRTIAEAVQSALSQEADFPFNILVVDNHSTDGTTALLAEMAGRHPALCHLRPVREDLLIGGCWNEAVFSEQCGRFAVQLDSDDLYSSPHSLQRIVDLLRDGPYAMVIGSYSLVDAGLKPLPPGLIDHREWTEENGRNNALRINGLGAPRAFRTELLRQGGFLNVSYGEDYAVALRLSRDYRLGRIYENLYLCRRWEGNSDAALSIQQQNRYNAFKDQVRTLEIMARQQMNSGSPQGAKRVP